MKLKFWHGVLLMGIIALLLHIRGCNIEKKYNSEVAKVQAYKDTVKVYTAKDGAAVEFNNTLKVTLDAFMAATTDSVREYLENIKIPKPELITIIKEVTYIDSIPSVSLNIADCKFDKTFSIRERYYEVEGRVTNEALSLKSIMVPNTISIVIGDRKEKWWRSKENIAVVTNSNPNITNEGISSFVLKDNQSRWTVGPSIGYGFYFDPLKGNSGHGITGSIAINYRLLGWKKK